MMTLPSPGRAEEHEGREAVGAAPPRLALASRSPRRRELLAEAGFAHRVVSAAGIDDSALRPGRTTPEAWVAALAWLKAAAGARVLKPADRGVVLGADTLCVLPGRGLRGLLGQPADGGEARATLSRLRGGRHAVLTGVALLCPRTGAREVFVDRAEVAWGDVPDAELDAYVASEAWRGKAGAYNLRERLDAGWPIEFEGDPTSIMGLPMRALAPRLARFGVTPTGRGGGSESRGAVRAQVA